MRRWMSRLSYSFLIVAGVLGYQAFRILDGRADEIPTSQGVLIAVLAVLSMILGVIGLRFRNEELRRRVADNEGQPGSL